MERKWKRLIALAAEDPELEVVAAVDWAKHPNQGKDAGELAGIGPIGIKVMGSLPADVSPESVIDFSTPEGTTSILATCAGRALPLVVATTGHSHAQREEIEAAAHQTAILFTANFSLVVNVLFKLVKDAGAMLAGKGFDVEIIERHHRFKKDSPSGTAVQFAKIIQQAMEAQTEQLRREAERVWWGERPRTRSASMPYGRATMSVSIRSSLALWERQWNWSIKATARDIIRRGAPSRGQVLGQ